MKAMTLFGSLLLSVALCGQGFGGELAARLLGLDTFSDCACGTCAPCEAAKCCGPTLREKLRQTPIACKIFACAPAACAAPTCEEVGCGADCTPRGTPVRDMLRDLRDTLFYKRCLMDCCEADCCEADCSGGCGYSTASDNSTAPAPAPIKAAPTPAPDAPKAVPVPEAAPIPPAPGQ